VPLILTTIDGLYPRRVSDGQQESSKKLLTMMSPALSPAPRKLRHLMTRP